MKSELLRYYLLKKSFVGLNIYMDKFLAQATHGQKVNFDVRGENYVIDTNLFEEYFFYLIVAIFVNLRAYISECQDSLQKNENKGILKEATHLYGLLAFILLEPENFYITPTGIIKFKQVLRGYQGVTLFYKDNMLRLHYRYHFYASLHWSQTIKCLRTRHYLRSRM